MADQHDDLWRAKIPADYDGRQGDNWDDEIDTGFAYRSAVLVTIAVAFSFVFCWFLIKGLDSFMEKPQSPIAEQNQRQLPPSPILQSSPEEELRVMRGEMEQRLNGYGWTDQLDQRVHIPVQRAMELVLQGSPRIPVEKGGEKPVDVTPVPAPAAPTHDSHSAGH